METPLIQFVDVNKSFGARRVLDGMNLTINRGEITTIIGKSGVGKSVLLKHMIGLLQPDSGRILFHGRPLSKLTRKERWDLKEKFSYMFQGTALFDSMTVYENIALPLKESRKVAEKEIRERVRSKMDTLELYDIDDNYPSQLSGGMKKRVALARALVTEPETVLFDEPTTGLDPIRKDAVHTMISDYQKRFGFTGVVVSHEIPDIFFISQSIAFLHEGRILFQGSPAEIQRHPDPEIRHFIHGLEARKPDITGLDHQTKGEESFEKEMARLQRHEVPFTLVVLTIENHGGQAAPPGETVSPAVFQNLAALIQERLRLNDYSYRLGPNKIVILLAHCGVNRAWMFSGSLANEMKILGPNCAAGDSSADFQQRYAIRIGVSEAGKDSDLDALIDSAQGTMETLYEFTSR